MGDKGRGFGDCLGGLADFDVVVEKDGDVDFDAWEAGNFGEAMVVVWLSEEGGEVEVEKGGGVFF